MKTASDCQQDYIVTAATTDDNQFIPTQPPTDGLGAAKTSRTTVASADVIRMSCYHSSDCGKAPVLLTFRRSTSSQYRDAGSRAASLLSRCTCTSATARNAGSLPAAVSVAPTLPWLPLSATGAKMSSSAVVEGYRPSLHARSKCANGRRRECLRM